MRDLTRTATRPLFCLSKTKTGYRTTSFPTPTSTTLGTKLVTALPERLNQKDFKIEMETEPTDSPALFIRSALIGNLKAFKYATVCLCCHFEGAWWLPQFAGRAVVREYPLGYTMMSDKRLIMNSMVRPTTVELSFVFTRISVQALAARKRCNSSWIIKRTFIVIGIRTQTIWSRKKRSCKQGTY